MSDAPVRSRRERLRAEALADIRGHAYAQLAEGGPGALSLNGIAKAMGMSGPALYRYFESRDALLATLVVESYEALADALTDAAQRSRRRTPERRLVAVAEAYRDWALAQPHRYRVMFSSIYGSGALDPERVIPASQRSMRVLVTTLAELGDDDTGPAVTDGTLAAELKGWGAAGGGVGSESPGILRVALSAWTRLHGVVSLEIEGVFDQMGIDAARLYAAEIERLAAERRSG